MKYDYQHKITFDLNSKFDIDYINDVCNKYPDSKVLVEIQNTKGITPDMIKQLSRNVLIRIAGGYDDERISKYKDMVFGTETSEDYYFNSVIYTRNETIKIIEEIEKIESGIKKNWTDIQKLIYIYDKLKTTIMYDPKFEEKLSYEVRSLRGLITKQTICSGYSLILKEFMDRNNIECEFARGGISKGKISGHAWNIVIIDGKKYPIDLTWDNKIFRAGKSSRFDWLGKNIEAFSKSHFPAPLEKTQNYLKTLSQIDPKLIKQVYVQIGIDRSRDYRSTTYDGTRKDGTKFILAQIGDFEKNGTTYYRYYYVEEFPKGKKGNPLILYSEVNVAKFVNSKKFNQFIPENYEETLENILFSRENILDSLIKKTFYIGKITKFVRNKYELVKSYSEIEKPETKRKLFMYPTRKFARSNGSTFIAQQMYRKPKKINGIDIYCYDVFELVNEDGEEILKKNTIFTEMDIFKDRSQDMVNELFRREYIDKCAEISGGYIGYYDKDGAKVVNFDLIKFFGTSKKANISSINKNLIMKIISFDELNSSGLQKSR